MPSIYGTPNNTKITQKPKVSEKKNTEVELVTTNAGPLLGQNANTQSTQSTQTKKVAVSFRETSTYTALLISGLVMLLGLIVFLTAVLVRMF